jgi:threonylcarbamoyladenosine tRNA methylthiotransferase MtaB
VPDSIKGERSDELLELEERLAKSFREKFMNKSVEVLFEEEQVIDGKRYFTGYTKEYVRIGVETEKNLANQLISVKTVDTLGQEIILAQM